MNSYALYLVIIRKETDLVEVLCIGAIQQRLEDDDRFIEVPHEHPVYCVDWLHLCTVQFTLCRHALLSCTTPVHRLLTHPTYVPSHIKVPYTEAQILSKSFLHSSP